MGKINIFTFLIIIPATFLLSPVARLRRSRLVIVATRAADSRGRIIWYICGLNKLYTEGRCFSRLLPRMIFTSSKLKKTKQTTSQKSDLRFVATFENQKEFSTRRYNNRLYASYFMDKKQLLLLINFYGFFSLEKLKENLLIGSTE